MIRVQEGYKIVKVEGTSLGLKAFVLPSGTFLVCRNAREKSKDSLTFEAIGGFRLRPQ